MLLDGSLFWYVFLPRYMHLWVIDTLVSLKQYKWGLNDIGFTLTATIYIGVY